MWKAISDIVQVCLSAPGGAGAALCVALAASAIITLRTTAGLLHIARRAASYLALGSLRRFALLSLLIGGTAYMVRDTLSDLLQALEPPVYAGQYDGLAEGETAAAFEREIMRVNAPAVAAIVVRRTRELADTLGVPVWWLYATALSECALNPFTVRHDGIAAGWIQFTSTGLAGLGVTLAEVKAWCAARDTERMMALTARYMHRAAGGRRLTRPVDVYLCVFAPGHVGRPEDAVIYAGRNNPAYYLNDGLDGYTGAPGGVVRRRNADKDGRITVGELGLCVEYRKNRLLSGVR